ncbi:MAG: ABC transporter permease, partial [Prevotellaceae bacterium]|nr:ABC transporter permease [Prevotellaceae bacterium]
IILFGFALSTEVRNIRVAVLAPEPDNMVRQIIQRLEANEFFTISQYLDQPNDIEKVFRRGKIDLVVAFGQDFSGELFTPDGSQIQIVVDASDANMAQSYATYTSSVIAQFFRETTPLNAANGVTPNVLLLYNPLLKSSYNFVPGIMGLILMLICAMMTSIAIVREKETGTMEVLLVSPVKPIYIILAKMLPYFALSCINLITILLLSVFLLKVPVVGSLVALAFVSLLYIFIALALGLLVSTIATRQIIALMFSAMLLLVPTMLLSGMAFPIENMPDILQAISTILPQRWYISAIRKLMIAGLPVTSALKEIGILVLMGTILVTVSLKKFKTRLE